jgi:predicted acyltransferase
VARMDAHRSDRSGNRKTAGLLVAGLLLVVLGLAWGASFPITKNLWTSSYAVFTGGMAAYLFGLLYWTLDVRGYRGWSRPFVVYGRNAILVFVASGLVAKTLALIKVAGPDGVSLSLQAWLHRTLLASWLPPHPASLAWAVANVLFWYAVLRELDRRRIYLKA